MGNPDEGWAVRAECGKTSGRAGPGTAGAMLEGQRASHSTLTLTFLEEPGDPHDQERL